MKTFHFIYIDTRPQKMSIRFTFVNHNRPQGVQIVSVMIKSCLLPKEIESQMEEKTKVISKNAQQRMFHQNNMQNTRMEEEIVTLMQTFEEQRQQEESAGAERINEEKVKLNDEMAEARKSEATIREEADASIQKLKAENSLEVQRVISRKVRLTSLAIYSKLLTCTLTTTLFSLQ